MQVLGRLGLTTTAVAVGTVVLAAASGCGGRSSAAPGPLTSFPSTPATHRSAVPVFSATLRATGPAVHSLVAGSGGSSTAGVTAGVLSGSWRVAAGGDVAGATCASLAQSGTGVDDAGKPLFAVPDVSRTDADLMAGRDGSIGSGHTLGITLFADPYHGAGSYRGADALGENGLRLDSTQANRSTTSFTTLAGNDIVVTVAGDGSGSFHVSGLSAGQTGPELSVDIHWTCTVAAPPAG